uniref:CCDC92/74 N-terminal domain-containing protein n=1 Tax=Mola mola TaxID=94237 RepID=A0A3Q3WGQ9_MOLML
MASSNVTLENQLHSAQKNLQFLQQRHADTLKGLHAEIRRLQQQCTDLTYELTMRSSDPSDSGEARCRELQRRCEELEAQLKKKEEENTELLRDLEQKNAMISVLENTIKEREKKYLEELKMKSHKLAVLSGELEQRASTIAYLNSQLHATKKMLVAGSSSEVSPNVSPVTSYKPTPPPAKDRQPETPRRQITRESSNLNLPELTNSVPPPAAQRRSPRRRGRRRAASRAARSPRGAADRSLERLVNPGWNLALTRPTRISAPPPTRPCPRLQIHDNLRSSFSGTCPRLVGASRNADG